MTVAVQTSICADCGAYNDGTRFCEACGQPATQNSSDAEYVSAAPSVLDRLVSPRVSTAAFVAAAVGYACLLAVPPLALMIANGVGNYSLATLTLSTLVFLVLTILALIVASASTSNSLPRRLAGIGLAIAFGLNGMIAVGVLATSYGNGFWYLPYVFLQNLVAPACFLICWAVATGQRPRVYLTLPIASGLFLFSLVGIGFALETPLYILGDLVAIGILIASALLLKREKPLVAFASPPHTAMPGKYSAELAPAANARTNTLAILALIFGILSSSVIAIVLGHMAHAQIKRTGEQGWGMATVGLVLGYVWLGVLVVILAILVIIPIVQAINYPTDY